ncbi:MAG: hypothetical protein PBV54_15370 [Achromobacter xylosoxidans]
MTCAASLAKGRSMRRVARVPSTKASANPPARPLTTVQCDADWLCSYSV